MDIVAGVSRDDINTILFCLKVCNCDKLAKELSTGWERFLDESPVKDMGVYAKKFIIQTH